MWPLLQLTQTVLSKSQFPFYNLSSMLSCTQKSNAGLTNSDSSQVRSYLRPYSIGREAESSQPTHVGILIPRMNVHPELVHLFSVCGRTYHRQPCSSFFTPNSHHIVACRIRHLKSEGRASEQISQSGPSRIAHEDEINEIGKCGPPPRSADR